MQGQPDTAATENPVTPAQVKFLEYHVALGNGDRDLADRLWLEYIQAIDAEMRRRAA